MELRITFSGIDDFREEAIVDSIIITLKGLAVEYKLEVVGGEDE